MSRPTARVLGAAGAPITTESKADLAPRAAFDPDTGGYLVVWELVYSDTDHDIYAQRVDGNGSPVGGTIPVATSTRWEEAPAVAYSSAAGAFLVVWATDTSSTGRDIVGRLVQGDGVLPGGEFTVAGETANEDAPDIATSTATGEFLVVYQSAPAGDGAQNAILAQRVGTGGGLLSDATTVVDTAADEVEPAVAYGSTAGVFLVAWQTLGTDWDLAAVRVAEDGTPVGTPVSLISWEYDQLAPRMTFDTDTSEFLVVWEDHHWGFGADWDIFGQRVTAAGTLFGGKVDIAFDGSQPRQRPDVTYSQTSQQYLVAWQEAGASSGEDVRLRRLAHDGSPLGDEEPVSDGIDDERRPAVAADDGYGILAVWEDERDAALQATNIYGRVVRDYVISGRVFEGDVGDTSSPLEGVTVSLYCSNNAGSQGTLVETRVTGPEGSFAFRLGGVCEFYNLIETNLADYTSAGATSPGGVDVDADWLQIAWPLLGKNLGGNAFWDQPPPADPPPGGWSGFAPSGWVTDSHTATCSVAVTDVGSGLDVATAEYAFTRDGVNWTAWQPATCTGVHGSLDPETVTATSVAFLTDSLAGDVNRIRFRVSDVGGNQGTSPDFSVHIDTTPPENPTTINVDRPASTWTNDTSATVTWPHATDATSGHGGYSFLWSTSATTIPDTVLDDVDNHIDTVIPGEGSSWYFHVRSRDVAGNWAGGATHAGPYWIDTTPPTNPSSVSSSTHTVNQWTYDQNVTTLWSDGSDAASGVGGYSFVWDTSPSTLPDAVIDTVMNTVGSGILADGSRYFHLRAVDAAGNAATTAKHLGPFLIDATPPSSAVDTLAAYQGHATFTVSWTGSAGGGSPIAAYDVRAKDENTGTTTTVVSNTTSTSTNFTGTRGHTYTFASRARDQAGNQESYPLAGGDAQTTVGKLVLVRVRNEAAAACSGAKVYHNSALVGTTSASGTIPTSSYALVGDTLAALCPVYEHGAAKGAHNLGSPTNQNWSWRAYQTSVALDSTGTTSLFTISNINLTQQDLTVKKSQSLIGLHVLVSVEWDANSTFLNDLKTGLESASTYLYDAGDGQIFWERIELDDAAGWWGPSDIRIHASNQVWPNANVGGINKGNDKHIYMGRYFNGNSANTGNWSQSNGFRTFIHEFGHYVGLWDEYLDRNGKKTSSAYCATNFDNQPVAERASIMFYQFTATEFCSTVDSSHAHRTQTEHDAKTGKSTWRSLAEDSFADSTSPARWTLLTPDDRGQIMAGPTALPIAAWRTVVVTNNNQSACAPYTVGLYWTGTSKPAADCDTWIKRSSPLADLYQGKTDANGDITILGARNGDTEWFCGGTTDTVSCSPGATEAAPVAVSKPAFDLDVAVAPLSGTEIEVRVVAGAPLAAVPTATLWQSSEDPPAAVDLVFDPVSESFKGTAQMASGEEPGGYVYVAAQDASGHSVSAYQQFLVVPLLAAEDNRHLYSTDGDFELVLPPGSLTSDAFLSIDEATPPATSQGNLRVVGRAYAVLLSSGQEALGVPGVVNMRYHTEQAASLAPAGLTIARWDENRRRWLPLDGEVDTTLALVSADVAHLSTFALLAPTSCSTRGDLDGDCAVSVGDIFYLVNALLAGGSPAGTTGDVNSSGAVDIADVFFLVDYLLAGGTAPAP